MTQALKKFSKAVGSMGHAIVNVGMSFHVDYQSGKLSYQEQEREKAQLSYLKGLQNNTVENELYLLTSRLKNEGGHLVTTQGTTFET